MEEEQDGLVPGCGCEDLADSGNGVEVAGVAAASKIAREILVARQHPSQNPPIRV
jgi:hypothetical protein